MEPFVAADDNAFGHLIGSIPNPVANLQQALSFKVGLAGKIADIQQQRAQAEQQQAEAQQISQKLSREQMFQQDLTKVQQSPDAQSVSALVMKYPEFADQVKSGWDLQDKAKQDADLTQLGEIYSAAATGNWGLASKQAHARLDADKAAGQTDPTDEAFVQSVDDAASGDPDKQRAVLTTLGTHIASVSGPEHFATVFGALKGGYTLDAGATRYDENGNVVAQSPFIKGADGTIFERDGSTATPGAPQPTARTTEPGGDQGFDSAIAFTLKHEGGYNPHDMNGQPVNFGINQGANPGVNVASLTPDEAKDIYKTKYWDQSGAANLPADMQTPYFDTYVINPKRAQQFLKASGGDPNKFMDLRQAWLGSVAAKNPQYAKAYATRNADLRLQLQNGSAPPTDTGTNTTPQAPPGYHVLVPGSTSPDQYRPLTDAEAKQRGLDTSQQYQLNTKTGQISGLGQKTGGDDVLSRYNIQPSETGPSVLAKLPASIGAQVKALAEGRLPMPSSFALGKPYWQTILQLTSQYDPSFDASSFPARKAAITAFTGMGKGAQIVGSVNRVANHLNLLWNESQKLSGPDTGFGPLNRALATAGQAFQPQDAKAYDTEIGFVSGELEKIARNSSGSVTGIERVIRDLGRQNSSSTRAAAIKAAVGIISGAIDPLKDQYNSAFTNDSTRPRIPWVTPQAQRIYRNIGGVDTSLTGQGANSNAPANAPATALPSGAKFVGTYQGKRVIQLSNGKRMVEQ